MHRNSFAQDPHIVFPHCCCPACRGSASSKTQQGARPAKLPRRDEGNSPAGDGDRMLEIREMQAAVLRTYVLPRDCGLAVAATDAAKNHVEQIKAVKGDQRAVDALGPVHVHVWAAALVSAAAQCSINQEDANTLKAHFDEATSSNSDPNAHAARVHIARFRKAWDKNTVKLHLDCSTDLSHVLSSLDKALTSSGAHRKYGQAPRGGLERQAQELLDALK